MPYFCTFTRGAGGGVPVTAGQIEDTEGNLYSTAQYGGDLSCTPGYDGCGLVFKLTP
jgi:hypothetical protein